MDSFDNNILFKEIGGKKVLACSYSQLEMFEQCPYKWYRTYVLGHRSTEKQTALEYGSSVHETIEYFFKDKPSYDANLLYNDVFMPIAERKEIPFDTEEQRSMAMLDAQNLCKWLCDLRDGKLMDKAFTKELFESDVVGVEEAFSLVCRLPKPFMYNGEAYDSVTIIGSIDLHVKHGDDDIIIDWKSGTKVFDSYKLKHNLQHPVYSIYVAQKYGKLPTRNYYFFTRMLQEQEVFVDNARLKISMDMIINMFNAMYDFNKSLNKDCKPSPLCYWCDFSYYKDKSCSKSSTFKPSSTPKAI